MWDLQSGSVADWVAAFAAIASAILTGLIAIIVHGLARQTARLDVERAATSASQEVNVHVMTNPEVADFYRRSFFPEFPDREFVRRLYHCFWVLNVLWDVYAARQSGLVSKRYYRLRFGQGAKRVVRRNPDCIAYIIDNASQYDAAFMKEVLSWAPDYRPSDHWPPRSQSKADEDVSTSVIAS